MPLLPPSRHDDPASDPRESLRSYYFTVLKRRWIVAAVALATFSAGALATFLQPLQYDASTLILVDWSRINLVEDVVIDDRREGTANLFATQEKILRSRVLARRVADELRFWEHPLFRRLSPDPTNGIDEAALKRIRRRCSPCSAFPTSGTPSSWKWASPPPIRPSRPSSPTRR
jgi:uncharacterized protein involved in exopolysaccharide biosynthesis